MSAHAHKNWGSDYEGQAIFARVLALVFMVLSIFMVIYAAYNFRKRGDMLQCALLLVPLLKAQSEGIMLLAEPRGSLPCFRAAAAVASFRCITSTKLCSIEGLRQLVYK